MENKNLYYLKNFSIFEIFLIERYNYNNEVLIINLKL
jgi:hypothetical protein